LQQWVHKPLSNEGLLGYFAKMIQMPQLQILGGIDMVKLVETLEMIV
jgi:hypothetical protein